MIELQKPMRMISKPHIWYNSRIFHSAPFVCGTRHSGGCDYGATPQEAYNKWKACVRRNNPDYYCVFAGECK